MAVYSVTVAVCVLLLYIETSDKPRYGRAILCHPVSYIPNSRCPSKVSTTPVLLGEILTTTQLNSKHHPHDPVVKLHSIRRATSLPPLYYLVTSGETVTINHSRPYTEARPMLRRVVVLVSLGRATMFLYDLRTGSCWQLGISICNMITVIHVWISSLKLLIHLHPSQPQNCITADAARLVRHSAVLISVLVAILMSENWWKSGTPHWRWQWHLHHEQLVYNCRPKSLKARIAALTGSSAVLRFKHLYAGTVFLPLRNTLILGVQNLYIPRACQASNPNSRELRASGRHAVAWSQWDTPWQLAVQAMEAFIWSLHLPTLHE